MNIVSGKILSLETGEGIHNLLVVAYDYDPIQQLNLSNNKALSADQLSKLLTNVQNERLGSVITNNNGEFKLEFEDDSFKNVQETEKRPDLLLCVMAPEDANSKSVNINNSEDRILYISHTIRPNAGRNESYVIRIPEEKLNHYAINPKQNLTQEANSFISDVNQKFNKQKLINTELQSIFKSKRDDIIGTADISRTFVKKLATKAIKHNDRIKLDPTIKPQVKLKKNIDAQLTRINKLSHKININLTESELNSFNEDKKEFANLISKRDDKLDKTRIRTLYEWCENRKPKSKSGFNDQIIGPKSNNNQGSSTTSTSTISKNEANQIILNKTIGQLTDLENHQKDPLAKRMDPLALQEKLASIKLKGGPADTTSYHDFNTLQIAFQNVWERVFDDSLGASGEELYNDWVKVREYLGLEKPEQDILEEFESLEDFVRAVESDYSAARGLSERTGTLPDWEGTPDEGWLWVPGMPHPIPNPLRNSNGRVSRASEQGGNRGAVVAVSAGSQNSGVVVGRSGESSTTGPISARPSGKIPAENNLLTRVERMLTGIGKRLSKNYAFDVFAPNTFNFGLLTTYRQEWKPESYQVGELVSTMPLAPGEQRSFSLKQTVKKSRSQKEIENALSSTKGESSNTSRADAEIIQKASSDTNFNQNVQGTFGMGEMMRLTSTTQFGTRQQNESQRSKKHFQEAVRKASQEYRQERKLEVNTSEEAEITTSKSGQINNPNNEISVTYLFYELQRRYKVREYLYRVRPVILVAQDVPRPDQIDEDWILSYEWIIRRVLLDDSLKAALDNLCQKMAGDEVSTEVLKANWQRNLTVVEQLSRQLDTRSQLRDDVRNRIVKLLQGVEQDNTGKDVAAAIFSGGLSLLFEGKKDGASLESTKEAAEREMEFSENEFNEVEARMRTAINALEQSTNKYNQALKDQVNHRVSIDQLKIHIKDNIIYYMQAIWGHEPSDQRFFRLYDLPVEWFELDKQTPQIHDLPYKPSDVILNSSDLFNKLNKTSKQQRYRVEVKAQIKRSEKTRELIEVADIDSLLGFKGNYMIFPLKENNALTEYMLQDYQDDEWLGVLDPDDLGNFSKEELDFFVETIKNDETISEEIKASALTWIEEYNSFAKNEETVIVPTEEIFIEALPGSHPVLEDFKLLHRAIDVKKAESEVRHNELENIRFAHRLVKGERHDPDIDKQVVINGDTPITIEP
jgi:hypothetical protein